MVGGDGGEGLVASASVRGVVGGANLQAAAVDGEISPKEVERTRSGRGACTWLSFVLIAARRLFPPLSCDPLVSMLTRCCLS